MPARFLAWVVGWSVLLWAALWGATIVLDPAGARAEHRGRTCAPLEMWKLRAFERSGARTAILGNSRVALGMDATRGWPPGAAASTFNLGLPGAAAADVTRLAGDVIERRAADTLVIGLDYGMFIGGRDAGRGLDEERDRLRGGTSLAEPGWLSRAEMRQVLNVACIPYEFDPRSGTVWWQRSSDVPFEKALHAQLARYARCGRGECDAAYRSDLESLRALVRSATRSGTRLVMFINPLPALHLEGIRVAGAGPHFERWKRDMAAIVHEEGGASALRDFAVFAPEVSHNRPERPEASESVAGFLDVSHYTLGLGRIVQGQLASSSVDDLFGAPLHPGSVERHLQRDRAARDAWAARHPQEIARLRERLRPPAKP